MITHGAAIGKPTAALEGQVDNMPVEIHLSEGLEPERPLDRRRYYPLCYIPATSKRNFKLKLNWIKLKNAYFFILQ